MEDFWAWYDRTTMGNNEFGLHISKTASANVTQIGQDSWRLEIPSGSKHRYCLAQLDDHSLGRRSSFRWRPPLYLSLQARLSAEDLPGTWGFGLWNDPFSFLLGYGGVAPRLPALPDAAWFFHASPENYLSVRNDLPANGFLAATFCSEKVSTPLLMLASPLLALTMLPGTAQWIRKQLRRFIHQDSAPITGPLTDWHAYRMEWETNRVRFYMDDVDVLHTTTVPRAPLSLVIWIDNQYAALPPRGSLKYGYLSNPAPAWLEIREFKLMKDI